MEAMIKKYFWTVNLVFLAIGAWLLANMTNVVVAHKLRPIPSLSKKTSKKQKRSHKKQDIEDNQVIAGRNFFDSAMAAPVETVENGPELTDPGLLEGEGVESSLRAALVGTIGAFSFIFCRD